MSDDDYSFVFVRAKMIEDGQGDDDDHTLEPNRIYDSEVIQQRNIKRQYGLLGGAQLTGRIMERTASQYHQQQKEAKSESRNVWCQSLEQSMERGPMEVTEQVVSMTRVEEEEKEEDDDDDDVVEVPEGKLPKEEDGRWEQLAAREKLLHQAEVQRRRTTNMGTYLDPNNPQDRAKMSMPVMVVQVPMVEEEVEHQAKLASQLLASQTSTGQQLSKDVVDWMDAQRRVNPSTIQDKMYHMFVDPAKLDFDEDFSNTTWSNLHLKVDLLLYREPWIGISVPLDDESLPIIISRDLTEDSLTRRLLYPDIASHPDIPSLIIDILPAILRYPPLPPDFARNLPEDWIYPVYSTQFYYDRNRIATTTDLIVFFLKYSPAVQQYATEKYMEITSNGKDKDAFLKFCSSYADRIDNFVDAKMHYGTAYLPLALVYLNNTGLRDWDQLVRLELILGNTQIAAHHLQLDLIEPPAGTYDAAVQIIEDNTQEIQRRIIISRYNWARYIHSLFLDQFRADEQAAADENIESYQDKFKRFSLLEYRIVGDYLEEIETGPPKDPMVIPDACELIAKFFFMIFYLFDIPEDAFYAKVAKAEGFRFGTFSHTL
jgi:hypothetical protein